MKTQNRVAWTEGMFLKVQHFQQSDRWAEALVRDRTAPLAPYPWGLLDLTLDKAALGIGRLGLSTIRGTLADGTSFSAPEHCPLPAPLQLSEGMTEITVYLALPTQRPGAPEFGPGDGVASSGVRLAREEFDAEDNNADISYTAPISVGRLALSLKKDGDDLAGFETLPIARVVEVRGDLSVVLDTEMIPPVQVVAAAPRLLGFLNELLGLLRHRAEAIARRAAEPSLRGSAELGDYLMLQTLNRISPLIEHFADQAGQIHPEMAYRSLRSLAGELATFTTATRLPADMPSYRHIDPRASFEPVMDELRRALSSVLDQTAVLIPLEQRRHGVRVGMIGDAGLKEGAALVLAIKADIPEERLRRLLPNQIKIGPVERIAELVNVALPGVPVRALPVAPRQLPFRTGTTYFSLESQGDVWSGMIESGTIALHLAAEFPGLEIELWGIKS